MNHSEQRDRFRWICLGMACLFGVILLWMISDFKRRMIASVSRADLALKKVNESVEEVNNNLPEVIGEIRKTSNTLSRVADDVELLKSVAGVSNENVDRGFRGLAIYADEIQQLLADHAEGQDAHILVEEVIGSDLRVVETVAEFLVGLNREMIAAILPLSKSRQEVLYRATRSSFRRKPYYIQFGTADPIPLEEYLREHHAPSRDLPAFRDDSEDE